MGYVLINDQMVTREEAFIDIEDRAHQFGDGIYEVVRVYQGRCFMMKEHLGRLYRSAQEIQLTIPYQLEELSSMLEDLKEKSNIQDGIIYLQFSRGVAARFHGFPDPTVPAQLVAYVKELQKPVQLQQNGAKAILTEDIRWLRCDIKSLNLLGNVLAKQQAIEKGAYEAILHRNGTITEGSSTNVFMIQEATLYTHPANNLILNGITRVKVIELCHQLGLVVKEQEFDTNFLLKADEIFITSSTNDILPIIEIDHQKIGPGIPGPITRKLQQAFENEIK